MAIEVEKARIEREISNYLEKKHDTDKKVIASNCRLAVRLALNHRELLAALESYRDALLSLVGKKNARRWFRHKAGGLDTILEQAIERNRPFASNEARIFERPTRRRPSLTMKDWSRHGDGKAYVVNGRGFRQKAQSIDEIDAFLASAGISNARLREYLCDYAHQEGLFAAGHLFWGACGAAGVTVFNSGTRHEYRSGSQLSRIHCRDIAEFNAVVSEEAGTFPLDPPLEFVQHYDLVDKGGEIEIVESRYSIDNLDPLPPELRDIVRNAFRTLLPSG